MSMSCLDCHDYMNGYNQGKKEGTIEELEKIKLEMKSVATTKTIVEDSVGMAYCKSKRSIITEDIVLEIIDKRISELKGNKNESE